MKALSATAAAPAGPDPEVFLAIEDLELVGRGLSAAVWQGTHRGLLRGEGVEFHSHQPYRPGDDPRRINWLLHARHGRLFTKHSQLEARRAVTILVDRSASMGIGQGKWSKFAYAARVAAGMAHLARQQGDQPALGLLSGGKVGFSLPPRNSADHVLGLCAALAAAAPDGVAALPLALTESRPLCQRGGFVILISDFLEDEEKVLSELAALRAQGQDVLALQVLDPLEVELPKEGDIEFEEPEAGGRLRVSVEALRADYAARVASWRGGLAARAADYGLRWQSVTTEESLVGVLRRWLEAV